MKVREFGKWLNAEIEQLDHDEIVEVIDRVDPERLPNHVVTRVRFANKATASVGVMAVRGPGAPRHEPYILPREVF
ncbi:hypothetical protein [Umezawaea beigongshangensis]|uniref:hypothetical protein n=1 Tax=Umezawaea beigongshangensis TaxID=2780383 RepID=UPI0018F1FF8C|nr:hypothetical protein [Umezawaea beigongshangensis]